MSNEEVVVSIKYKINVATTKARMVLQLITKNGEIAFASTCYVNNSTESLEAIIPSNILNSTTYYVMLHIGEPGIEFLTKPKQYVGFNVETVGQHGAKLVEKWPGVLSPKLEWIQK